MKTKIIQFNLEKVIKDQKRKRIIKNVDKKLLEIIKEDLPFFKLVKRFVVFSGGKRIRPLTHYYFCKLLNYTGKEWIDVAAIGELIHAASLLHDDVIDNSNQRRGRPTLHILYGNKKAILGGDYLLACGIDHLQTLEHGSILLPVFTRVIKNLSISEILQMEYENNPDLTEEIYEKIIIGKTADLFSAMTESAAILSSIEIQKISSYRNYGLKMGRLFQIRDDFLDYFSTEKEMGKELYQDYIRGLITYPLIVLRKFATNKEKKEIFKDWHNAEKRKSKLPYVLELMEKYQIRKKIAMEIEENIHSLMNFIRNHNTLYHKEREEMLLTLNKLMVPVEI
ncbi:MAG: geranylgeranyl pyrophosphate synthase [Leptospiraceae bacterium]|nr:MAG: geranylgeranyl pyrophosphate synthase [Leptospiraceae bacterium]